MLFFSVSASFSQQSRLDSLKHELGKAKHDTTRIQLRNEIGEEAGVMRVGYWDSLAADAQKARLKKIEAHALDNAGYILREKGDLQNALLRYQKSVAISREINDGKSVADALAKLGIIYNFQGNIPQALKHYREALDLSEKEGYLTSMASVLSNIGIIYSDQGDLVKSIEYVSRSLAIRSMLKNKNGMANSYNNLGYSYAKLKDTAKAMECYQKELKVSEETGDKGDIAQAYNNIGTIYFDQEKYELCLTYYLKALEIRRQAGLRRKMCESYSNICSVYLKLQKPKLASVYADSAFSLAKEYGPKEMRFSALAVSKADSAIGKFASAFQHYKIYIHYRDGIQNENNKKLAIRDQMKYEFEKKEAVLTEQQEKERAVAAEKNRFQQIVIASVIFGLLVVIAFAFYVFRSLKTTRHQKILIEEKQKEIIDSIRYAKRIQRSLLPTEKYIERNLNRLKN